MNEEIFNEIKEDIRRKGIYYGEIVISCHYHDGRICTYSITTTERRNCNKNAKNAVPKEMNSIYL
ncbi:MAG: hypothetical protein J5527_14735 [Treponema sp.]|nr:hypothetical protein [Treponema sp.]